jgi:hypothetical protein
MLCCRPNRRNLSAKALNLNAKYLNLDPFLVLYVASERYVCDIGLDGGRCKGSLESFSEKHVEFSVSSMILEDHEREKGCCDRISSELNEIDGKVCVSDVETVVCISIFLRSA